MQAIGGAIQSGVARASDALDSSPPQRPITRRQVESLQGLGRISDLGRDARAKQAATQMLSELFFKPMLAELRDSPLGGRLSDGGQTESIFGERLDERIADAVASSSSGLKETMLAYLDQRSSTRAKLMGRRPATPDNAATVTDRGVKV